MEKKMYRGYLFDLDGTVYKGGQVIPEAVDFIGECLANNIPYQYVTNNSALTPYELAQRLCGMGIEAVPEDFFTSSMAAAGWIQEREGKNEHNNFEAVTVLAIGENGLHTALNQAGVNLVDKAPADYVVIGIDRQFTYEKMKQAALAIRGGAVFISTNSDRAVPSEEGLLPGNGALTASIATATGTDPIFVGKPETAIIQLALDRLKLTASDVLLIGDNLETDIAAGHKSGVDTLLVFGGFSSREDVEKSAIKPTYTAETLKGWQR
ncbi:TIGR01457 family HAD-type hydrolase [Aneurinibacillus sp. Ricciae_BoGa-3]|uniref:TIGR01457 family HAD-type hydrolase n=1 Tax=Aneurinibacillus sp. Ricciae_BoGa-3 TaxID=3022697 RepID=UPI00233FF1F1|nr:TIGR01457 family HAD-type hydrolase [Aneurinibacillus sp. Ricciae_BoGa-3]WCK53785.1 TIGR01457 family HAD-type hydrolase [Aneurinibacillus sp. Ricciae_BoGa-3]